MQISAVARGVIIAAVLTLASRCEAGKPAVSPLTEDQRQATDKITKSQITAAVTFLSSDELAGRDTPSAELSIAESYVASRFRAAGLEGAATDGSYFLSESVPTIQFPVRPAAFLVEGSDQIQYATVLTSRSEETKLSHLPVLTESEALRADRDCIAVVDDLRLPVRALSRPRSVVAAVARRVRALAAKGIRLVLLSVDDDSELYDVCELLSRRPVLSSGLQLPDCCVALVSGDAVGPGRFLSIRVPATVSSDTTMRNVAAVLRGSDQEHADEWVVISAHLDHIGVNAVGTDRINNGADDNATGVTAVLSLADAYAALETGPRRSVMFVTFWGEEKGLLGSRAFVRRPPVPLDSIVANLNFEMVGRPERGAEGKAWMTGWRHSNLGELMNAGSQRVGVTVFDRQDVGEMLYSRSDNFAFVQSGVVAHSFSAGSLHSDYHQPSDEWPRLQLDHMTTVVRGLFAGSLALTVDMLPIERR